MSAKRTVGAAAALGGFLAALALLSGLPSAKADELSDLRANQQQLQQRVEQLRRSVPGDAPSRAPRSAAEQPSGGGFPRSFLIPGTETSIRVGGRISETATYGSR